MAVDEKLQTVRHSCAHVMAEAILKLFPGTKIAIGPAIENGFYYDFEFPTETKFTETDFAAVEKEMRRIISGNHDFVRKEISKEEGLKLFADQPYKIELIKDLPEGETITTYEQDGYLDLCRGPHVANTKEINGQAFKLTKIAGAYWRGDSNNKMLTRVYAVCFAKPNDLKDYLKMMEEAEKRDHRKLGVQMDLFHLDPEDPGQIFWHPNGWTIYTAMQDYMRKMVRRDGYQEVNTPAIMPRTLWERSGHWGHYQQNMFITESEKRLFAIKPMNCPGAILVYKNSLHSYKDLPLRYAELGHVHRHEASGALNGLFRVRGFTQDDAHTMVRRDQLVDEINSILRLYDEIYSIFGLDYKIELSTRPEEGYIGDIEIWNESEKTLKEACEKSGHDFKINPGDGAFYGPKLDFKVRDSMNRVWQCGTIQLDMNLPERFDCFYIDSDGEKKRPIMLHRACFGSLERFFGIIIEHFGGAFPTWLAPVQVALLPVNNDFHLEYSKELLAKFQEEGLRVELDDGNDKLGYRMRNAQVKKIPYTIVIGDQERDNKTVTYRKFGQKEQITVPVEQFLAMVQEEIKTRKR